MKKNIYQFKNDSKKHMKIVFKIIFILKNNGVGYKLKNLGYFCHQYFYHYVIKKYYFIVRNITYDIERISLFWKNKII